MVVMRVGVRGSLVQWVGAKKGTQNIDRILRLPGTINLPNARKLKDGRKQCPTKLLWFNGAAYDIGAFPLPEKKRRGKGNRGADFTTHDEHDEGEKLDRAIKHCDVPDGQTRSHVVWYVINEMLRRSQRCYERFAHW
jgi:hypothetical protein